MQPFLEVPIGIVNSDKEEKETVARLVPNDISYFYPGFNYGTVVVMKSGSSFITLLTYDEFDGALNGYSEHLKKHPGKFGTLKITSKPKSILHPVN